MSFILLILSFVTYPPHADVMMMLKIIAQNTTSKHLSLKPCLRNRYNRYSRWFEILITQSTCAVNFSLQSMNTPSNFAQETRSISSGKRN